MNDSLQTIYQAVLNGDMDAAHENVQAAVDAEIASGEILNSALLTTTMPSMKTILEAVQAAGMRDQVKIVIGGAPITEEYTNQIGADGYASDANQPATLVKKLIA